MVHCRTVASSTVNRQRSALIKSGKIDSYHAFLTCGINYLRRDRGSLARLLLISEQATCGTTFEQDSDEVGGTFSHSRVIEGLQELSSSRMPSQLEGAMGALITVFYNYSGNDGDKHKLNKGELKELLHSELTDFLMSQKDPMLVEKIMNDLDTNKDNEVDFNEFVVLVAALTVACNDFFQEQNKNAK
ncbi:hypothetical protein CCH79_00001178 [Gambusia affinis]|uniref:EF-hand domain-containing protein n=3 Tax=Cyprinodontiformes TaxID=28738 RepID=A0A315VSG7_GAMAF|nr:hypothetical protein CCH79_00001178 [Gambusia affinis]